MNDGWILVDFLNCLFELGGKWIIRFCVLCFFFVGKILDVGRLDWMIFYDFIKSGNLIGWIEDVVGWMNIFFVLV